MKTLALRVERQSQNAFRIAEFLSDHQSIRNVNYPGLPNFKGYETAKSQMKSFGAMLSFEIDEVRVEPTQLLSRLQLIRPAVSLGGIETIICSPAQTSHVKISAEERKRVGISEALLRLSVGIEHVDDLIADLEQALLK